MAINDCDISDKTIPPSLFNIITQPSGSNRQAKANYDDDSLKRGKTRKKKASPYLFGEKVQLISKMSTEKKVQKKNEIYSSFPLATNIYRASSDEFKAFKKMKQKARKSVLTLPNVPAPIPNVCTVSDMNDSDYLKNEKKIKPPNRFPQRKNQSRTRGIEFYDRDANRIDCSSQDLLLKNGDGKQSLLRRKGTCRDGDDMQDVWSVLRNLNKFQFRPTPRISDEDSLVSDRKKIITRKFRPRKGRRLIGTCRTEEVAYVADFEIQSKTSASQSSSFDRITVIDKSDLQNAVKCDNINAKPQNPRRIPYKPKNLIPLNEKKTFKSPPNLRSSQVKDNRLVAFIKKQNEQMNKIFTKTVNSASINQKRPESTYTFNDSIDSSNCLRESDYESSNCTLKPKLTITHPNAFKGFIFNRCPQNSTNVANNDNAVKITNGTTQVVFNKNNIHVDSIMTKGPLKPRLVTTMPSAATMPKLTAGDIKRRLAHYKFPLVILGKDEVSSTLEVFDYEPPQFCGLNKHIWPFMIEWKKKPLMQRSSPSPIEAITDNVRKATNEIALQRPRDKKAPNVNLLSKKNIESKRGMQQEITLPPCGLKKIKPMRQLKDKMIKLLYKNTYPGDIDSCQNTGPPKLVSVKDKIDAGTEMTEQEKYAIENTKNIVTSENANESAMIASKTPKKDGIGEQHRVPKKLNDFIDNTGKPLNALQALNMKMPGARHPWAKAKWASDFVDNVMTKINNGSYYGIEDQKIIENHEKVVPKDIDNFNDSQEVSIETCHHQRIVKVDFEQNYNESGHSLIENDTYDPFLKIPGFDDALPNLEIKTLNANQIQVKNCLTNVMVQFDVSVPNGTSCHVLDENSSTSSSFIPLSVSESNTRIYKCSTTILNAILPAELCTVLPKLMQNIFDSNTTLASSTTFRTLTISEISECESEAKSPLHRLASPMSNTWMNQFYPPYPAQPYLQNNFERYPQTKQWKQNPWACPPNPCISPFNPWNCPQNPCGSHNPWGAAQHAWNGNWVPPYVYGWPEYLPIYISPRLINYLRGRFGYLPRKPSKRSRIDIVAGINLKYTKDVILPKTHTKAIIYLIVNPIQSTKLHEFKSDEAQVINPILVNKTVGCTTLQLYKPETKWIPSISDFTSIVQKMWNYCKFNVHYALPKHIMNANTNIITFNRDNITVDMVVGNTQSVKKTMSVIFTHVNNFFVDSNGSVNNETKVINVVKSPKKLADYSKDLSIIRDIQLAKKVKERVRKKSFINLHRKCKSHNYGDRYTPLSEICNIDDFTLALGAAKALCNVFDESSGRKILSCIDEMKEWIKDITPGQALLVLLLANKKETQNLLRFRPVLLQGIAVNRITRMTELDMEIEVIERENLYLGEASDYQKPFDESSERLLRALLGKRKKLNPSYLRVMARYVGLGLLKKPSKFQ